VTLRPGARFGHYEILDLVGEGGMGEVYRARDSSLDRTVAIKVVSEQHAPRVSALSRLEREARALAKLSHPNIVTVHEVGASDGTAFIVMELLEGTPLAHAIPAGGMAWTRAATFAAAIADALACAHEAGVVHRDLKPANVFVTRDDRIKVLDFGIAADTAEASAARMPSRDATAPGLVVGTMSYMSPEQVNGGRVDPRSDIFALGCVLYEMLSGRGAFARETTPETMAAILRDQPHGLTTAACGDIPRQLAALVARCLEKHPERRFQSARDLAFALREILRHAETAEERPASTPMAWPGLRPALAAAVVIITIGALWFFSTTRDKAGSATENRGATGVNASFVPSRPEVSAAVDAYLRGRRALDRRTEADIRDAIRAFDASIDADPAYAPAYAGLSDAYGQFGYGSFVAPEDAFPRARAAAERALALAPTLAEAHASLAYTLMYYAWEFAAAEREFRRALELNPNLSTAHQWYAYVLTALERPAAEAKREIAAARALDPLSVPVYIDQAYILHYYGRNDDALDAVRRALEMNAAYPPAFFWRGRIYTAMGRYDEAREALERLGPLRSWTPAMAALGYLYGKSGQPAEARAILAEFDALAASGRYASAYAVGAVHAGLGDREHALSSLAQAYRERSHWLVWLKRDPRWNEIRGDARFQQLVRDVGLPQ
jgi:serine/threonine protein kinase/tetratricopeptide (TPR) repeat protein